MADINPAADPQACTNTGADASARPDAEAQLATAVPFVELLFFAYRDFTGEPDGILDDFGFGRAHHRVLHFVHRNPGLRVAALLEILKITKQSLARVLKQLIHDGYITQEPGRADRRERHLYVTERGQRLAERLLKLQAERIGAALAIAGPGSEDTVRRFLVGIIAQEDRESVANLIDGLHPSEP